MNTDFVNLITDRTKTHGDFTENSRVSQALKSVIQCSHKWSTLNTYQKEALEMIMHKVSRIVEGDPNLKDHWDDIAGYSKLVSDRLSPSIELNNSGDSTTICNYDNVSTVNYTYNDTISDISLFNWDGIDNITFKAS